jgi:hypothetical protein
VTSTEVICPGIDGRMAGVHLQLVRIRPEGSVRPCKEQQEAIRPD